MAANVAAPKIHLNLCRMLPCRCEMCISQRSAPRAAAATSALSPSSRCRCAKLVYCHRAPGQTYYGSVALIASASSLLPSDLAEEESCGAL